MVVSCPDLAHTYFMRVWPGELLYREKVVCLFLNHQKQVIASENLFSGGLDYCSVDPRVIYREAFLSQAVYVVIGHNHPNGSVQPSECDLIGAEAIQKIAVCVGLPTTQMIITPNHWHVMYWMGEKG